MENILLLVNVNMKIHKTLTRNETDKGKKGKKKREQLYGKNKNYGGCGNRRKYLP